MTNQASIRGWLDSGLAAHRRGDVSRAIDAYRQALALAPDDVDALNLLGTGLLQTGDTAGAVSHLERAARQERNNPKLLANLGQAYLAAGRPTEAGDAFRKASRIAPQELHFQLGLATALAMQGNPVEASALLKRLAERFPESAEVWFNLGNALRDRRAPEAAIAAYRKAIAIHPGYADALNNMGSVHQSRLRFAEAEASYRECLEIAPDHRMARYNLASVAIDVGRFSEAEAIARELVTRAPEWSMASMILGAAVGHQGRLLEARACFTVAVELAPDDQNALQVYAGTSMEIGRVADGLRWFSRALALNPQAAEPRQLLASCLLGHGHVQDGWSEYGWRPAALRFREKNAHLALARDLPESLHGKHVCVLREQGLGDELFFLRYVKLLAARGARITYRASDKIATLLERAPFIDALVAEATDPPAADVHILLGDLPHALARLQASALPLAGGTISSALPDFADHVSLYWPPVPESIALPPLASRIEEVRGRLSKLGPPPYIGVTWRAGTAPEDQNLTWLLYKAIASDALARALTKVEGTILALQRKPAPGEIESLSRALGRPVHDFTDFNDDLESMLALLALIDDYVGVSNTNMHLRAAVGRTARVLVPAPAEWRWMQSGRSSPWFPGFSIYRQSLQGDWSAGLDALKRDLEANYAARGKSYTL